MEDESRSQARLQLLLLSFVALFLELMLIRWVPSVFKLIAYYANLLLISSFLGLGLGSLWSHPRRVGLFHLFPVLLGALVILLTFTHQIRAPASMEEARFFASPTKLINYLALILLFVANTSVFFSLGIRIGALFKALPSLVAYSADLAGSFIGTVVFGLFSFFHFSPILGMGLIMACYLILSPRRHRLWMIAAFLLSLVVMVRLQVKGEYWSPYYYITVYSNGEKESPFYYQPPPDLRTMKNPPLYNVHVNHDFYQVHGTLDLRRYEPLRSYLETLRSGYALPFVLQKAPHRVLVLGAGGGLDVEVAVQSGVEWVDAVEIDPTIIRLAKRFAASGIYERPGVHVINDDARAVLERAQTPYDVVIFGHLDSQALFNSMANVRLDGFVYTVESLRSAFRLVKPGGLLCLSFSIPHAWLAQKLYYMLKTATGLIPVVYYRDSNVIFCLSKGPRVFPETVGPYRQLKSEPAYVPVATDDWPYLYLSTHAMPFDYVLIIGFLLALSLGVIAVFQRGTWGTSDWHFFFLGAGFLLLETKSIIDSSLFLGATWLVTTLIVAGVLLMVFAANGTAIRLRQFSARLYIPLLLSLVVLLGVPHSTILSWSVPARVLWVLMAVPLPVFFAGLIFSTTFRGVRNASFTLGANLIGATFGGFLEYGGMIWGYRSLSWMVVVFYLASLLCVLRQKGPVS